MYTIKYYQGNLQAQDKQIFAKFWGFCPRLLEDCCKVRPGSYSRLKVNRNILILLLLLQSPPFTFLAPFTFLMIRLFEVNSDYRNVLSSNWQILKLPRIQPKNAKVYIIFLIEAKWSSHFPSRTFVCSAAEFFPGSQRYLFLCVQGPTLRISTERRFHHVMHQSETAIWVLCNLK